MADNDGFGFDPQDLDRFLRGALGQFGRMIDASGNGAGLSGLLGDLGRTPGATVQPTTTGETGDGVWAIYTVDDKGGAQVEQVFATELDALRANKHNTDSARRVRFLPYGIAVSALDEQHPTVDADEE